jgi:DUF917 family protein
MSSLTVHDLDNLAYGSSILGSGGGGNPAYELLMARIQLEKHGSAEMITIDDLRDDDCVIPLGMMGAPLVIIEKLPSGKELEAIFHAAKEIAAGRRIVLMPLEIGGLNAFAPLTLASRLGVPILDADLIGRAFPQLQMTSCNLAGVPASPAIISDSFGNTVVIRANALLTVENLGRHVTIAMGSSAGIAAYIMSGKDARRSVIPGSISWAIEIGHSASTAIANGIDPLHAVLHFTQGAVLGSGIISDINQVVAKGFLEGSFTVSTDEGEIIVLYQNEYLAAQKKNAILASTPDIIIPLEQETGSPITSESLQYGLRVNLIALPSPQIWKSEAGLKVVGPRFFGYDFDYKCISERCGT